MPCMESKKKHPKKPGKTKAKKRVRETQAAAPGFVNEATTRRSEMVGETERAQSVQDAGDAVTDGSVVEDTGRPRSAPEREARGRLGAAQVAEASAPTGAMGDDPLQALRRSLIPINPRQSVYLCRHGHGEDERFARLFGETLKQVRLRAGREIYRHWREDPQRYLASVPDPKLRPEPGRTYTMADGMMIAPRIEVLNGWIGGSGDSIVGSERHCGALGGVYARGHCLRFHALSVDRMPEEVVRDLVAHELAHVYLQAIGVADEMEQGDLEQAADEVMDGWGFDSCSIDEWAVEVGITEIRVVDNPVEWSCHLLGPDSRYYNPSTP